MTRDKNELLAERVQLGPIDHIQVTADTVVKLWTVPAGRKFRLRRAVYINPTGLAADPTNYFDVEVLKGATVMAKWSTLTGSDGALVADTPTTLALSATDASRVAAAGDVISLSLNETGTATLPAGRIVIEGELL